MPTVNKPKTRAATADRHEPRSRVCTSCHKLPRFCDCAPGAEPTCPICHNVLSSGQHFPDIQTCLTDEQAAAGRTGAVAASTGRSGGCTGDNAEQYYVTAEIKPTKDIEVIRIEATPTLEHHHRRTCDHVRFLRSVGQRHEHGKLETKPLLRALAAWPLAVLKTIASMRYGTLSQETEAMPRGLRPLVDDSLVAAINRCALNEASDNDRVMLGRKNESGDRMLGPCELVECDKHPGHQKLHRWTWHVPEDGDHLSAIQCGDVGSVSACPICLQSDIEASQPAMGLKVKVVDGEVVLDGNGRQRVKAAAAANRKLRAAAAKRPTWCQLAATILNHVPSSLECGAIERSPEGGHWLRLTTADEYDFIVDIEWRSGVLSMAEIDEGGEVFEAMKTRRANIDEAAIGPTVAGWLAEMVAEMEG